ncbi:cytochrome P450 (plasmid) [Streptantibioticus cattleyicolor NRRL 8057 = DSM 46488]|uniref:Cytochrome P450 n=1 Tax=Streptantibioticus cattleyicolor (strain ATCC 35852 / DSM 46488 / JCM 4925 / NBRC 14057 / NRRL 8057) TaxID=1003195 RepID=G8XFA5_STREN|nr:cytochrome P450 [Streptantibioticus cattleyicolor NRRL 8057 = DSM 46488]
MLPAPGSMPRSCPLGPPDAYRHALETPGFSRVTLQYGRYGTLLTRYEDVRAALRDERIGSALHQLPPVLDGQSPPGWFFGLDGPEHARYRRVLAKMFSVTRTRRFEPVIRAITDELLDALEPHATGADRAVDLMAGLAWPLAVRVPCALLGISGDDQATFKRQVDTLIAPGVTREEITEVYRAMWWRMRGLVDAERSGTGGQGLFAELVADQSGPDAFDDDEIASIGLSLRIAGLDPIAHLLGLGLFALLCHPEQLALVRAAGADAVEELLRFVPFNNMGAVRVAVQDTVVDGEPVAQGEVVVASLTAANRDATVFADPDTLDVTRHNAAAHLAFGHGPHRCLGRHLAGQVVTVVLDRLLGRFPGLRLAVAAERVPPFESAGFYGVAELPVHLT